MLRTIRHLVVAFLPLAAFLSLAAFLPWFGAAPASADDAAPAVSLDALAWLEGSWHRETKRGVVTERWDRVSDDTMEGTATVRSGENVAVTEHLRLERMGGQVFYVAKPRENPMPTPFLLVASGEDRFVFENPAHDFPQRIIYARDGELGLVVRIEGMEEGGRGIDFVFARPPEKDQFEEW